MELIGTALVEQGGGWKKLPPAAWILYSNPTPVGNNTQGLVHALMIPNQWPREGALVPDATVQMTPEDLVAYARDGIQAANKALYGQDIPVGTGGKWTVEDGTAMMPFAAFLYGWLVSKPWLPNGDDFAWAISQSPRFQRDVATIWQGTDIAKTGVQPLWFLAAPPSEFGIDQYPAGTQYDQGDPTQIPHDNDAPPLFLMATPGWVMPVKDPPAYGQPSENKTPTLLDVFTGKLPPGTQPIGARQEAKKASVWPWVLGGGAALAVIGWALFADTTKRNPARPKKTNMLPPDVKGSRYAPDSWTAWESAVAAAFGGIVRNWPEWAKDGYKRHHGYLP